ncbi:F-box protein At3g07870-like [Papaver somniferum]|uniref:F-box protein At3g07870-like n=1 Tax=Papaver somniferum TaxID=3469 RepID=UPI000E700D6D|nr:F-box protein At3g07870-like [Papaver somniferum]
MEEKKSREMMTIDPHVLRSKRKCKLRQEIHVSLVNSLPSEITIEILSRLPTDSILQCRLVCKTWRKILLHPSFAHVHLQQFPHLHGSSYPCRSSVIGAKVGVGFLFGFSFSPHHFSELYCGEFDDTPKKKLKWINQPPIKLHSMVSSCNGLICFSDFVRGHYVPEPSYISNPITGEYVTLPKLEITSENKIDSMVCGFGYHSSINRYKIVKIYYIQNQPLGRVQVYTLGCGNSGWRDVGETAYSLQHSKLCWKGDRCPFGVLANGALHWLDMEQKIASFDLVEEKLYLLPSPDFVYAAAFTKLLDENCYGATPHVNSFVSLKALGERCRSRKRYKANPSPRTIFIKQQTNA